MTAPKGSCCAAHGGGAPARSTVKDLVCGMDVNPDTTAHHARHAGSDYHFCSDGCRRKFVAAPQRYLDPASHIAELQRMHTALEQLVHACPGHGDLEQCPILGALAEPRA